MVSNVVVQFSPDGSAMSVVNGVPTVLAAPLSVMISRHGKSKTATVNNVGKVQLQ
jgi:hypothetical protein